HEVGFDQHGVPFYSMRRLRGRTWAERWRGMRLREHLDVLIRVCDPVAYAHGRGVLHRDLKPGNVFLGEYGEVVVFDWGLAIRLQDLRRDEALATASGTPAYMAPEMARADGRKLGPASDVYLLGATLYEILTGEPPHPGVEAEDILAAAADNVISPPIPDGELGGIAARAMATDPAARYPDVRSFQSALRIYLDHQESVSLAARARERLVLAERSGEYDDFSRAVHGFEDAAALWSGNAEATAGMSDARLAYARRASSAGDLDLAAGLLDPADPLHRAELERISGQRDLRLRRRRALRALWWISGALLLALIVALTLGYAAVAAQRDLILRIAQERDAAESALVREQSEIADGRQRLWHRVLQEDFGRGALPPLAKVVAGSWRIDASALRAEGPGPCAVAMPIPASEAVHVQLDVHAGGRLQLLLSGASGGVEIVLDRTLSVRQGGRVLTEQPLPEEATGLARRLRVEDDAGSLRVLVDGRVVVPRMSLPQTAGLALERVAIQAMPGTVLDNLKVEVPWR
ncbi:MAG: serine/threonine protein kinase, partial [Planctomycetes bacterium]|nr:serine/threonine protein kinase [Planctomycetota bacterium]